MIAVAAAEAPVDRAAIGAAVDRVVPADRVDRAARADRAGPGVDSVGPAASAATVVSESIRARCRWQARAGSCRARRTTRARIGAIAAGPPEGRGVIGRREIASAAASGAVRAEARADPADHAVQAGDPVDHAARVRDPADHAARAGDRADHAAAGRAEPVHREDQAAIGRARSPAGRRGRRCRAGRLARPASRRR
jgi:hypothetical protein